MSTTTLIPTSTASTTSSTGTSTCTPAPPAKHDYAPDGSCEKLWEYDPQVAPAVVFALLFAILLLAHVILAIVHRKRFALVLILGVAWELAAYVFRVLSALHQRDKNHYNNNFILTLTGPLWINAFVFMTLGRMIFYFMPEHRVWRIKGRLLARWFVLADIICFFVQIIGVIIAVIGGDNDNTNTQKMGLNVFNAGAGIQQGFVAIFAGILTLFVVRAFQMEKRHGPLRPQGWKWLSAALYFCLSMITIRCIFRLCMYSNLDHGPGKLMREEIYEYLLDAGPMMLAALVLAVLHPGLFLVGPESTFPRGKAKKELKRQEKERKAAGKAGTSYEMEPGYKGAAYYEQGPGFGGLQAGGYSPSHTAPSTEYLMR